MEFFLIMRKVSAVVSTYNSEKFIYGRLINLTEQTLYKKNDLEIIVIDSNSKENEKDIVEKFKIKYPDIILIRTEKRETYYQALNRGIKITESKYFINANTDDRFRHDALEILADNLDRAPGISAVYPDWFYTNIENDIFESKTKKAVAYYPEFYPPFFLYFQVTSHASMIRKSVFNQIGDFNEEMKVFGDREFMLRLSSEGFKAKRVPMVLGLYYRNPRSLEHQGNTSKEFEQIREKYIEPKNLMRLFNFTEKYSNQELAKTYEKAANLGKDYNYLASHALCDYVFINKLLKKSMTLNRHNSIALINLAVTEAYIGEKEKAKTSLREALLSANSLSCKILITFNLFLLKLSCSKKCFLIWKGHDHLILNIKYYILECLSLFRQRFDSNANFREWGVR